MLPTSAELLLQQIVLALLLLAAFRFNLAAAQRSATGTRVGPAASADSWHCQHCPLKHSLFLVLLVNYVF